jgi:hypothetical protein
MWDKASRFATDRLNDLKNIGGAVSNEIEYASDQLNRKVGDAIGGPVQAFTKAGVNPLAAVTQDKKDLDKAFGYYQNNPNELNNLGLKSNMVMRYFSGVGSEGLTFPKGTGQQLLTDIKEQDNKFKDPSYRQEVLNNPNSPDYLKQGLSKGHIPVYYGGFSDAPAPIKSQLPTDVGQRDQLSESMGSFWAKPQQDGSYTIDEDYNFGYAPINKGGVKDGQHLNTGMDMNPVNIGRRIVQKGYGKPYSYQLQLSSDGELNVSSNKSK